METAEIVLIPPKNYVSAHYMLWMCIQSIHVHVGLLSSKSGTPNLIFARSIEQKRENGCGIST